MTEQTAVTKPTKAKVTRDGIDVYWGEFLYSPIPMELSGNYCSHKCAYCFANLAQPGRTLDAGQVLRQLSKMETSKTYLGHLLRERRPVCVSNHVDPFAASNHKQMVPLIKQFAALGFPLFMQTKGGHKGAIAEVLESIPPTVWYISISFQDDTLRKINEPGAPSLESRFALIQQLKEAGHEVLVGINPCTEGWITDPDKLAQDLKALNVWGAWAEVLHLSRPQRANLTTKEKEGMGEERIKNAGDKKHRFGEAATFCESVLDSMRSAGLQVFGGHRGGETHFWAAVHALLPGCFLTKQDFVNHIVANNYRGHIYFDMFYEFIRPSLPGNPDQDVWPIDSYIGAVSRQLWKYKIPPRLTLRSMMRILWNADEGAKCIAQHPNFCFLLDPSEPETTEDGTWFPLVDNEGNYIAQYSPEGFNELFVKASPFST